MLLSINMNFIVFSIYLDDALGSVFVFFVLTVAAAESAIGLALLTLYYRIRNSVDLPSVKGEAENDGT